MLVSTPPSALNSILFGKASALSRSPCKRESLRLTPWRGTVVLGPESPHHLPTRRSSPPSTRTARHLQAAAPTRCDDPMSTAMLLCSGSSRSIHIYCSGPLALARLLRLKATKCSTVQSPVPPPPRSPRALRSQTRGWFRASRTVRRRQPPSFCQRRLLSRSEEAPSKREGEISLSGTRRGLEGRPTREDSQPPEEQAFSALVE